MKTDDEQDTLPEPRGRSRSRGMARSHSHSSRGHGGGQGTTPTLGSPTTHHPESTNHLEAMFDNWHKRESDSCTYVYNKTPGSTVPIPEGASSLDLFYRFFTDEE